GRACYVSSDKEVIVWLGEEDQLRIVCMKTGTKLMEIFEKLRNVLSLIETLPGIEFAQDEHFGYITSCPSNLGTGMRASAHVPTPGGTFEISPTRRLFLRERDIIDALFADLRALTTTTVCV